MRRIAIVSDIHYAGPREQAHGPDFELAHAAPSLARSLVRFYRHHFWMRNALAHNAELDRFLEHAGDAELVVANGDYTCDVAGLGVSDDEALESVRLCLGRLRQACGERLHAILGDHELGKLSLLGDHGGLRLASWRRATEDCGLRPFWRVEMGNHVLLGVTSTLVALPVFRRDALAAEWPGWEELREAHLAEIRAAFAGLSARQRVVLFCHDPTALPFLWREPAVRARGKQIARTIIGHLHTRLLLWKSRLLAGMPPVQRLGVSVQRMTTALNEARHWRPFKVRLCPSLAGIELFKRGGYLTLDLDESGTGPVRVKVHPLRRPLSS
jgi:hypothetical protein